MSPVGIHVAVRRAYVELLAVEEAAAAEGGENDAFVEVGGVSGGLLGDGFGKEATEHRALRLKVFFEGG